VSQFCALVSCHCQSLFISSAIVSLNVISKVGVWPGLVDVIICSIFNLWWSWGNMQVCVPSQNQASVVDLSVSFLIKVLTLK